MIQLNLVNRKPQEHTGPQSTKKHFTHLQTNCSLVRNSSAFVWTINITIINTTILTRLCIE